MRSNGDLLPCHFRKKLFALSTYFQGVDDANDAAAAGDDDNN